MDIEFYKVYFPASLLIIAIGVFLKVYIKKTKVADYRRILSASAFWLNVAAIILIVLGVFVLITNLFVLYFDLKINGYL